MVVNNDDDNDANEKKNININIYSISKIIRG